jgi:hypothetical protein
MVRVVGARAWGVVIVPPEDVRRELELSLGFWR